MPLSPPWAGPVTTLNVNGSPSASAPVSVTPTGVFCGVKAEPGFAVGGSFTGVTVMLTVAEAEFPVPSLAVKVKLSGPL